MSGESPSKSERSPQPPYDSEAFAVEVLRAVYELQVVGRAHPDHSLNVRFPDGVPEFLLAAELGSRTPWDRDHLDRAIADLTVRKLIKYVGKQEALIYSEYVCSDGRQIWYGPVGNLDEYPQQFAVRVDGKRVHAKFRPSWDCPIDFGPRYTVTKAGIGQINDTQEEAALPIEGKWSVPMTTKDAATILNCCEQTVRNYATHPTKARPGVVVEKIRNGWYRVITPKTA